MTFSTVLTVSREMSRVISLLVFFICGTTFSQAQLLENGLPAVPTGYYLEVDLQIMMKMIDDTNVFCIQPNYPTKLTELACHLRIELISELTKSGYIYKLSKNQWFKSK